MTTHAGWWKVNRAAVWLFLISLIGSIYVFPRWADPNQNSRLDMVIAVVDDGTFRIDKYVSNTVDYARVDGHFYSDKPPGAAFLGMPIYAAFRQVLKLPLINGLVDQLANSPSFQATLREGGSGVYAEKVRFALTQVLLALFLAALPTAVTAVLIYQSGVLLKGGRIASLAAGLAYAFLTPVFAYSNAFYGHQLSAMLLFSVFWLSLRVKRVGAGVMILTGLLLVYAVITEYPLALAAAIMGILWLALILRAKRPLLAFWWLLPLMLGILLLGWYNQTIFGDPLKMGYEYSENWVVQHGTGFMSLTYPRLDALWGITFSRFRGLFLLSPLLLGGIGGFGIWYKRGEYQMHFWAALLTVVVFLLFNASSAMWWGGFSVGPRYILGMLPFLCVPLTFGMERAWERQGTRLALLLMAIWSLLAVWGMSLAGQSYPHDTVKEPYSGWLLPHWQAGDIARNMGSIMGLKGIASLIPLLLFICAGSLLLFWFARQDALNFRRKAGST